jgi:hypothetical protein
MHLVGLDQSEPDKPRDPVALHLDEKPQRLVRGRGAAPRNLRWRERRRRSQPGIWALAYQVSLHLGQCRHDVEKNLSWAVLVSIWVVPCSVQKSMPRSRSSPTKSIRLRRPRPRRSSFHTTGNPLCVDASGQPPAPADRRAHRWPCPQKSARSRLCRERHAANRGFGLRLSHGRIRQASSIRTSCAAHAAAFSGFPQSR